MRDMNPRNERSIRNIPVPASHRHIQPAELLGDEYDEDVNEQRAPKRGRKRFTMKNRFIWAVLIVVVLCAVGGLLLSTVFAGATVTVTPRTAAVTPPASILAQPNAPAGGLSYQVVTTSRTGSTTVPATGTEHVSRAATGVLTIFNTYSTASQPLIANTRFEAPNGNIYRIHDAVTVPGMTGTTPGSVTVSAFADAPGDSYNVGATQFTIPGFQGDPRYTKFYATTDAMTGGLVGDEPAVAPADLTSAENLLKQGLQSALTSAAQTEIPKEFLPIPGTLSISYGGITQTPLGSGSATVSQTASASADIVRTTDLAAAIAAQTVQGYNGEAVDFADPSQISIALEGSSTVTTGPLQLQLSGSPTLVWQFDPAALKAALVGKVKGDFETIIQTFAPAIECTSATPCKASVRPFWSSSFPSNPNKISIITGS